MIRRQVMITNGRNNNHNPLSFRCVIIRDFATTYRHAARIFWGCAPQTSAKGWTTSGLHVYFLHDHDPCKKSEVA